nr:hypothetical protein [Candidatus Sigynarchaeota archaeon]
MAPKKRAPGPYQATIDAFDCHQPMTPANIQQVANLFLPSRREIRVTESIVDLIEVYKTRGKDLCWLYRLLKEAAPHVDAIDDEWCAVFNVPDFLTKHPGYDYLILNKDGTRRIKERCSQEELFLLLPQIFDDEQYKYVMVHKIEVSFEEEFLNAWRQRLGKWVIPLRPEGKPGPFCRDSGEWLWLDNMRKP